MDSVITLTLFRRTVRASAWALLLVDLFVLVVWAASGGGSFWPIWVWLPTGLAVASAWWAGEAKSRWARRVGEAVLLSLFLIGVWAAAGRGSFWPVWPIAVHRARARTGSDHARQEGRGARRGADADPRRSRRGGRDPAAAHRARPARRRAGAARRARHEHRPRRAAAGRRIPRRRRSTWPRRARRRAPRCRSCATSRAASIRRSWPTAGSTPRSAPSPRTQPCRSPSTSSSPSARRPPSRRPRTSSQPRAWRTR